MALELMHVLLFAMWAALIISFYIKDYAVLILVSFIFVGWGLKALLEGIGGVQDWFTEIVALCHIFAGVYLFLRGSWETYKNL